MTDETQERELSEAETEIAKAFSYYLNESFEKFKQSLPDVRVLEEEDINGK